MEPSASGTDTHTTAVLSGTIAKAYAPWASQDLDWLALTALLLGGTLGFIVGAVLCGCECCSKRLHVSWRWCYVARLEDVGPPVRLPSRPPAIATLPTRIRHARAHTAPQRVPTITESVDPARAWNDLRDALGPEASDATLAQLLETHGDDVQAAAEAFYATPRFRTAARPTRDYPGHAARGGYNA